MIMCFGSSFRQPHLHAGEITLETLRAWRNAVNPTFSVQSWIARELSALRRLWCSLSCGRPRSWWCAGVLLIGVTVLKYSSHLSFHFSLAHFLMIFPCGDCVWLFWCSVCEASCQDSCIYCSKSGNGSCSTMHKLIGQRYAPIRPIGIVARRCDVYRAHSSIKQWPPTLVADYWLIHWLYRPLSLYNFTCVTLSH